jgi:uracil-DNA glycosylase family 4
MTDPAATLAQLAFLVEAGADETIGDEPVNRFAAPPAVAARAAPAVPPPAPAPVRPPEAVAVGGDDAIGSAQALAAAAGSLDELKRMVENFDGCPLKRGAAHTVFADGNPASRVMLIGEAPGREEDRAGVPFVGRAGKLLDKMLAAIGRDRNGVYITNVVAWRPPENREPTPEEVGACLPFLRRHIELVDPALVVLLGAVAVKNVMGLTDGIMRLRGRWLEYRLGSRMVPVLPTLHPAYLLRQPAQKKLAWHDLMAVAARLAEPETA